MADAELFAVRQKTPGSLKQTVSQKAAGALSTSMLEPAGGTRPVSTRGAAGLKSDYSTIKASTNARLNHSVNNGNKDTY